MDPGLKAWLTETAYYAAQSSLSDAGDYQYGSPVSFLCRSEPDTILHGPNFVPRHGEDKETNIILFTEVDVPAPSLIWIPGADQTEVTESRRMKRRETVRDDRGAVSHYEIYI